MRIKNKNLHIRVSEQDLAMLTEKAKRANVSNSKFVILAIELVNSRDVAEAAKKD